jgi:hypothetical protein
VLDVGVDEDVVDEGVVVAGAEAAENAMTWSAEGARSRPSPTLGVGK